MLATDVNDFDVATAVLGNFLNQIITIVAIFMIFIIIIIIICATVKGLNVSLNVLGHETGCGDQA